MTIIIPPWVHDHLVLLIVVAWIVSNMIGAMPSPGPNSGAFYKWAFGSLHAIFGAVPRIISTMAPAWSKYFTFGNGGNGSKPSS